jgi:hypothetical protein
MPPGVWGTSRICTRRVDRASIGGVRAHVSDQSAGSEGRGSASTWTQVRTSSSSGCRRIGSRQRPRPLFDRGVVMSFVLNNRAARSRGVRLPGRGCPVARQRHQWRVEVPVQFGSESRSDQLDAESNRSPRRSSRSRSSIASIPARVALSRRPRRARPRWKRSFWAPLISPFSSPPTFPPRV